MNFANEHDMAFLRSAAQALQDENERLRAESAALEARVQQAEEATALQQAEIQRLQQEVQLLQEHLDRRVRDLYGKKSERRPVGDAVTEPPSEARTEQTPTPKPRKGHGPTPQPRLPRVEVVHELAGDGLACGHCGGTLTPLGLEAEVAELISIEARKLVLERHLRTKYRCSCCHTGVKTAPGPVKLIPGGRYSLPFAVEVALQKYFAHMPLDRQAQMMRHEGLNVTTAALFDQVDALATTLTPTFMEIWKRIQAEPVLRADETPWAVLSNGHNPNERFYAWVAVGESLVAYRLLDTRSKEGAATILGDFAGTLMVDGLTSYPAAARDKQGDPLKFKVANCMAHARRKFVECENHYPDQSKVALDLMGKLYLVEREGKEPGADLASLRRERSRPLVDELFTWARAEQQAPDLLPSSGLAKALAYLVNHEAGLRVFLDDPAVPIDNNESERALRGPVIGRKNYTCSRSRRGAQTAEILFTLVESAKRVGVAPWAYLEAAAETALSKPGAFLLPDEFKRQLESAVNT
ncbi:MAG: IS66 family transposase [bacterium]|nr:IS66 family transposase [bacterium]